MSHRTITLMQLEWLPPLRMRWVTTWACPTTLKTVSVALLCQKKAASCQRALGKLSFAPVQMNTLLCADLRRKNI